MNELSDSHVTLEASWLHPTSLVFEMISHFKQLIVPAAIALLSAAQGSLGGLYFAMVFFIPAVVYSIFQYFTLRYKIDNGELVVKRGLIFRMVRTVPIGRVQNIDLVQNPLHRLFRVAEVRIETASGTEPEAVLRVLSMKKVARLREEVFRPETREKSLANLGPEGKGGFENGLAPQFGTDAKAVSSAETEGVTLLEIPTSWLVKAGIASDRGLILLGILVGAWFQFDLENSIDLDTVSSFLPEYDGSIQNTLILGGIGLVVFTFFRLLGVAWYILRFHGYRLTRHGEDLRISCGLFTKISATMPRKRVQFVSIHRSLVMRWFKLASIRVETAGGASLDATTTVSRRWFAPVIPEARIVELVSVLRPELKWDENSFDWKPLAPNVLKRLNRKAIVQTIIIGGIGIAVTRPWGWLSAVPAALFFFWWARKKSRSMKYARTDRQIVYRSGILTRKVSMTFFDKVQVAGVSQSPFDLRWKMATLYVDTAAAGPAEHRIRIPYLDVDFANYESRNISIKSSQYQPDFG